MTRHRGRHVGGSGERGSRRRRTSGTVIVVVTATAGEDREGQREQPNRDGSHTRETVASCGRNPSEEPTIDSHYSPLEVEPRVLRHWDETRAFDRLRELRAEAPEFRFLDGPITANNPMGVHHAWGRTLKDAVIRFHAMQGQSCRYQNGFDCQGLWVEVEVERALGFRGKPDIEAFGLDNFSRACRERVDEYAQVIAEQSTRLGQWMDWDNSYFTYSDDNIEAIWYFLQKCFERKYLYEGHVPLPWCTRCGTSLSQHEMLGSYVETERPVAVREREPARRLRPRARALDDHAVDAARERRGGGPPDAPLRRGRVGRPRARPQRGQPQATRHARRRRAARAERLRARRPRIRDLLPRSPGASARSPRRDPMGGDRPRGGFGHRPHRARLRTRGLRAQQGARSRRHHAARRARRLRRRVCVARRPQRGPRRRRRDRAPARRGPRRPRRALRAQRARLLAVQEPRAVPARVRVVHLRRRRAGADARGRADGRVGTAAHRQPHGRLAPQHGRLVHLAQALLGPAAPLLPVRRLPGADRRRVARRIARARARPADGRRPAGAPPAVDRRHQDHVRVLRCTRDASSRGRRLLARRGHHAVLDARLLRRPRRLEAALPGRVDLGDARAGAPLVLLDALHERGARRARARTSARCRTSG